MAASLSPCPLSAPYSKLLFEQVVSSLLPVFRAAGSGAPWQAPSGLRAVWTTSRDPVFATTTVTLRVLPPGHSAELVAKHSLSELLLSKARSEQDLALMIAESVKFCCGLLAPHLYEYDPRRGTFVSVNRPELSPDLLFDPPGWSPPIFVPEVECPVCNRDFFPLSNNGGGFSLWGGGNLGFIHAECGETVGVSPLL